jgi:hypothetical protein
MRLFPKKQVFPSGPRPTDEVLLWLKTKRMALARKLAAYLSSHEQKLSTRQKKGVLAGFVLLMVCFSVSLFIRAVYYPDRAGPSYLQIPTISQPRSLRLPDSLNPDIRQIWRRPPQNKVPSPDSLTK